MDLSNPITARIDLLGASVDLITQSDLLAFIERRIRRGRKALIANHNAHSLALIKRDADLQRFFNQADLVEIDSRPLIAWAKLLGLPARAEHRCTYLDWRDAFWEAAAHHGWRVFHLGGAHGVAELAAQKLRAQWPDLILATHHGFFDRNTQSEANKDVVATINAYRPDILLVGMGMPLQEHWIHDNYAALTSGVVMPIGGAFDYEAGVQAWCPRWIGQLGFEWLYRLLSQPRRLFRRYLLEPWTLVPSLLADVQRRHLQRAQSYAAYLAGE